MLVVLEITVWSVDVPNHIYYLNRGRDKVYGYARFGADEPQWFKAPISFDARGRKFLVLEEQPDRAVDQPAESWHVQGSKGSVWTVTRENGDFMCDCPSAKFHRKECRHIQQVRESLTCIQ